MSVIVTGRVFWTQFENIQYTDKSGKVVKIGKPSAKLVMLAIADSADDWGENSWQSFETIAAKSSVERRSVMRVVRGLILSKYLSIGGVSRYGTNDYKINLSLLGNPPARRAKNGRPKTTGDSIAETGDSIAETGDSIAETGYSIAETGDSIAETGDSIAETGDSIAETGDRTSPYPSLTHPNPSPQKTKIEKRGDLVQGLVDMSQAPGIKRAIRIDNLESLIKVKTSINPTGIKWKTFLQFVDDQQQKENKSLIVFLNWMMDQPNYNPLYWSADRMRQYWDMAFIEEPAPPQYTPPPSTGPAMSREQYQAELARPTTGIRMSLSKLLREFHNDAIPTERDFAECLELAQAEVDRIGELIDSLPVYDQRVVARVDQAPVLSRFSNIDALANWLYGEPHE